LPSKYLSVICIGSIDTKMSSVLVHNIKQPATADKLIIHFQKRKNRGGDVDSIIYPLTAAESDAALVNFEEENTADDVLGVDQYFNGIKLQVKKEYNLFSKCTVTVKPKVVDALRKGQSKKELLEEIRGNTPGVQVINGNMGFIISGSWHHLQSARHYIRTRLLKLEESDCGEKEQHSECSDVNYQDVPGSSMTLMPSSLASDPLSIDRAIRHETSSLSSSSSSSLVVVSAEGNEVAVEDTLLNDFVLDRDVMEFLQEYQKSEITKIEKANSLSYRFLPKSDDFVVVSCTQLDGDNSAEKNALSKKLLLTLFADVQNLDDFQHEILSVNDALEEGKKLSSFEVLKVTAQIVHQSYPETMVRTSADGENYSLLSLKPGQVDIAMEWFTDVLRRFNELTKIDVHACKFGFVKQTKMTHIKTIERETSTKLIELSHKDDVAVFFEPQHKNGSGDADACRLFRKLLAGTKVRHQKISIPVADRGKVTDYLRSPKPLSHHPNVYIRLSEDFTNLVYLDSDSAADLNEANVEVLQVLKK